MSDMKYRILVVEDEAGIREAIAIYLKNQGYEVIQAENGQEGLRCFEEQEIHLAVVDIMMPVMDGFEMVMRLRTISDIPVIFLSAKSQDLDKITGLDIGADDYMTKPFGSMELIARVKACLRRYEQILTLRNTNQEQTLVIGNIELNTLTKEVFVDQKPIALRPKEFQILALLMAHPGQVFSASQIYEAIWKEEAINTETIMVHIRKLREKIEVDPKHPQYLKVVWGIGYKMEKGRN